MNLPPSMTTRMKTYKKRTLFSLFVLGQPAMLLAQANAPQAPSFNFGLNEILWLTIIAMALLLLFLLLVLNRLVFLLKVEVMGPEQAAANKQSLWEKILSLKPISAEKDLVMEHEYDGIQELDNPTPPWFNFLFYGTILIAVVYLVNYHIVGDGNIMESEYAAQMEQGNAIKAKFEASNAAAIDETNVELLTEASEILEGSKIFAGKCKACHGDLGEGKTGPNLTDEYWIHGGDLKSVFKTIKYGVQEKGMAAWGDFLKPKEIQQVSSYILSIQGTVPAGQGKAPQGEKYQAEPAQESAPADTTQTVTAMNK